jgi:TetR/AcrR family transcriptional regulator of autoinduction and epiphytic fitness
MKKRSGRKPSIKKRNAILDAAVSEFQKNGFNGTSMDRVAETAEVSKRTVYNHFPSKEELFEAILNLSLARSAYCKYEDYDPNVDCRTQLIKVARDFTDAVSEPESLRMTRVIISRFLQSPEIAASTLDKQAVFYEGLVAWLKAAQNDGRLRLDDPLQAATQLTSLLKASAFWPQLIGNAEPLSEEELSRTVASSVDMFLARYGCDR